MTRTLVLPDGRVVTWGERAELWDASGRCVRVLRADAPIERVEREGAGRAVVHPERGDPLSWSLDDGSCETAKTMRELVVLVTGATRGIGRAVADACARRGATVVRLGRADADVRDARAVEAAIAAAVRAYGRVDLAIHAAGVGGARAPGWTTTPEELADVLATNVGGAFHLARALLAWAASAGAKTRLFAISSGVTEDAPPDAAAYVASKHALEGLVRALAADAEGTGATIGAVRLGSYRTDMTRAVLPARIFDALPDANEAADHVLRAALAPEAEVHGRVVTADARERPLDLGGVDRFASPLGPSPRARAALAEHAASGALHLYPDPSARALREAVATKLDVPADHVVVGAGASDLLDRALRAFAVRGERVVANAPTWPLFPHLCAGAGLVVKHVNYTIDGRARRADHDLDGVLAAIDRRTRIVYLVSPANPVGIAIDEPAFARFLARVPPHVTIVVDEAYVDFVVRRDALRAHRFVARSDRRLVVLRSFSKLHGLAGLRIGYAVAQPALGRALERAGMPFSASGAAQAAAIAALSDDAHVAATHAKVAAERARIEAELARAGVVTLASDAPFFVRCFGGRFEVITIGRSEECTTTTA